MSALRNIVALAVLMSASPAFAGGDIEVFTTSEYYIVTPSPWKPYQDAGYRIVVFKLDDLTRISEKLSEGLPANAERAKAIAEQRLAANGGALRNRMQRVSAALERAVSLGVSKYPAIVFNAGEAVVYGETHVARAIAAYEREKASRP